MAEDDSLPDADSLSEFLSENYPLFALLGVFGALILYLSNLRNLYSPPDTAEISPLQVGIVSSSLIFILILVLLLEDITK